MRFLCGNLRTSPSDAWPQTCLWTSSVIWPASSNFSLVDTFPIIAPSPKRDGRPHCIVGEQENFRKLCMFLSKMDDQSLTAFVIGKRGLFVLTWTVSQTRVTLRPMTHCADPDSTRCVIETGFPKLDLVGIFCVSLACSPEPYCHHWKSSTRVGSLRTVVALYKRSC